MVGCTWDDVPHLDEETKIELRKEIPPYQLEARTKGIPQLGSGAIFPIAESDLEIKDFAIPDYWPRAYGMDVGWNKTAAIWGARNNDTGVIYLFSEYYKGLAEAPVHASGINARGKWIPGVIDPAAHGRSQVDGRKLFSLYKDQGLDIENAVNAREAGIQETWLLMSGGQLKVFKSLRYWWTEFRTFQRDKNGQIMNESDYHLMAATRYFVMSGRERMKCKPAERKDPAGHRFGGGAGSWMGA